MTTGLLDLNEPTQATEEDIVKETAIQKIMQNYPINPPDRGVSIIMEYIWLDAGNENNPTSNLRSKTRVLNWLGSITDIDKFSLNDCPNWDFDGSSTNQAKGNNSELILFPIRLCHNPVDTGWLVLCEVLYPDGTPHKSNYRAKYSKIVEEYSDLAFWFGIEQEYFINNPLTGRGINWPTGNAQPLPQGRYYCGVGGDVAWGRDLAKQHREACLSVKLDLSGVNAEVAPSQWEYQIGPCTPLEAADQLWLSRYILNRLAETAGANIELSPKPISGDWNGTGAHINFSTLDTRIDCSSEILAAVEKSMSENHSLLIKAYGEGNNQRLTGQHETCNINEFKMAVADRGASIRVPNQIAITGKGYLEDRRPAGNMDPYRALGELMSCLGPVLQPISKAHDEIQKILSLE